MKTKKLTYKIRFLRLLPLAMLFMMVWPGGPDVLRAAETASMAPDVYWLFKVDTVNPPETAVMIRALAVLDKRLTALEITDAEVSLKSGDTIAVRVKSVPDVPYLRTALLRPGLLEFKLVADQYDLRANPDIELPPECEILSADDEILSGTEIQPLAVYKEALMTGYYIADARSVFEERLGTPYVRIELDDKGRALFAKITEDNIARRLAIVLDGRIISAPTIHDTVSGGSIMLAGNFSLKETRELALILRAGALPAPLAVVEERLN